MAETVVLAMDAVLVGSVIGGAPLLRAFVYSTYEKRDLIDKGPVI